MGSNWVYTGFKLGLNWFQSGTFNSVIILLMKASVATFILSFPRVNARERRRSASLINGEMEQLFYFLDKKAEIGG